MHRRFTRLNLCIGLFGLVAAALLRTAVAQDKPGNPRPAPGAQPSARPVPGKPVATAQPASKDQTSDPTGTYQADPVHSSNLFRIRHANIANFYGRFNDLAGTYTLNAADPTASTFEFEIKTASIDTRNQARDKHLRSAELFDAEQFPTITFKSTKVRSAGERAYEVTGDLTLHGVTKPLTTKVELTGVGTMRDQVRSGLEATFAIDRRDFGMTAMPGMLGDEVKIMVSIEGVRQ